MMLCLAIPAVLSGPLLGVIADRYQRKSIMITSDLCRCLLVVLIPLSNHIWEIGLLLCLLSVFSSLFEPAKSAVLKEAAGGEFVQTAVAFSEMINNLAKIAGPVIGGILVSLLGIRFSFYLDAASFVLSAILLAGLTEAGTRGVHSTPATLNTIFTEFLESFMFLKASPILLSGLFVLSFIFFTMQMADSQVVILFRLLSGSAVHLIGLSMAASGLGMLAASLILSRKTAGNPLLPLAAGSLTLGLAFAAAGRFIHIGSPARQLLYPLIFLIAGSSFSLSFISFTGFAQAKTPPHMTGRVFGTINSIANLSTLLGLISGGLLSEYCGVVTVYMLSGTLLSAIGVFVLSTKKYTERKETLAKSIQATHHSEKS